VTWYLLGEKFTNDSNFFVCEIGQGRGVGNVAWKWQKCCREEGGRWWRQESGLQIFWHTRMSITQR